MQRLLRQSPVGQSGSRGFAQNSGEAQCGVLLKVRSRLREILVLEFELADRTLPDAPKIQYTVSLDRICDLRKTIRCTVLQVFYHFAVLIKTQHKGIALGGGVKK